MRLGEQWREIEGQLPERWDALRLSLSLDRRASADRAAALLSPLAPGLSAEGVCFTVGRRGGGAGPESVRRLLARLDKEAITGKLELLRAEAAEPAPAPEPETLAVGWDAALATLPADWSDLYAEVGFRSTDHLERAAVLLSPLNPARFGDDATFRFRAARRFGYGASAEMARRCFERCDAERITGRVAILRALSDTRPVATQGPVWYLGGKTV